MRARALAVALGVGLASLASPVVSAQSSLSSPRSSPQPSPRSGPQSSPGLGRQLGRPLRRAPRPTVAVAPPAPESAEAPWVGPQIQLSYDYFKMHDGWGGGDVHAGGVGVFVQMPVPQLRLGFLGELGSRDFSLGGDDFLARASVEIGFQLTEVLEPLVPHISFVVSGGAVVGKRFETTVSYAFGGAGVEIGAALRLVRNFHLMASFGYHRLEMDGAAFDVFLLRVGLGM